MTQKSCAVGMRNAKLGNHLKHYLSIIVAFSRKIRIFFPQKTEIKQRIINTTKDPFRELSLGVSENYCIKTISCC